MAIDICVCTFRRASLETTLQSLDQQKVSDHEIRIIIIDNDDEPSAKTQVETLQKSMRTPVTYVHAPARNISIARNAGLDAATAEFVAFIDDDEYAPETWLSEMVQTAERENLDIVFGPTMGRYRDEDPKWIRDKNYHSFIPYRRFGTVETGGGGNAFIRFANPVFDGERFLLEMGRTGGEDTEFFNRIRSKGARVGIASAATLFEPVEQNRLTFDWIASRKYRSGISYGRHVGMDQRMTSRLWVAGSSGAKILFSGAMALILGLSKTERNYWMLRSVFHAGVFSAAIGRKESELY